MWLINTSTITLQRVNPDDLPSTPYAILSHTWGKEEVTFEDMMNEGQVKSMLGYTKIENTCRLAKERGLAYAWVDTCCIDKRSSAELAEAINSMFRWYKQASVCFAHLDDLTPAAEEEEGVDFDSLNSCRWFTRGWTLQELIGPKNLEFYDCAWKFRGKKANLGYSISQITGIHEEVLKDNSILESVSIASRMSWAAKRKTTRIEDMAYCLLGIVDVNMPMMYGEGTKAFERLQEEIIKQTTDMSIFAWKANDESQAYRGILAQSPDEFIHCRRLSRAPSMRCGFETTMTNKGLRLETFLGNGHVLNLACTISSFEGEKRIGVFLTKTADGYVRSSPTKLFETTDSRLWAGARYKIFIRKRVTPFVSEKLKEDLAKNIAIRFDICPGFKVRSFAAKPADLWDHHHQAFISQSNEVFTGFLDFQISDKAGSFLSSRIIVVCSLFFWHKHGFNSYVVIYDPTDASPSKAISECVDDYYQSYGEEYYLSHLRWAAIERNQDRLREVNVPSGDEGHHLCISSDVHTDSVSGANSLLIRVASRTNL
ncbi:beta transducin [Fusarium langsethiae]|uniref:Beta transducin n=1 Tax=Fusarium langsethiae TaxID=179993 RepID=A0A0M9EPE9_FUSLA|nr:beta transducin [Fusarium langsethiae]